MNFYEITLNDTNIDLRNITNIKILNPTHYNGPAKFVVIHYIDHPLKYGFKSLRCGDETEAQQTIDFLMKKRNKFEEKYPQEKKNRMAAQRHVMSRVTRAIS